MNYPIVFDVENVRLLHAKIVERLRHEHMQTAANKVEKMESLFNKSSFLYGKDVYNQKYPAGDAIKEIAPDGVYVPVLCRIW